ncbi:DNA-directed RNA polymerase I subunit RPA43 [Harmonia axyridis]|uniref:DNA-directed RNA polymerase I subunit RPA43 n=1 Tax=Harmonia axyridis TaxID=115357 RepID=UPI001E27589B|nr:DNA-directed RNA polymerase I subunit RPA43 [Harmonia axyridis]
MGRTTFSAKFLNHLVDSKNSCVEMKTVEKCIKIKSYGISLSTYIKKEMDSGIAKYDSEIKDYQGCLDLKMLVDFYVFKPVIGKTLQGVVFEQNQEIVGCLVYKTFTVSLLNSEEGNSWAGNNLEIGQKITFRIKSVVLTSRIPYIEGEFLENLTPVKRKIRFSDITETEENCPENIIENEPVKKRKKSGKNHENTFGNESQLLENSLLNDSIKLNDDPEEKCAENIIENVLFKNKTKSRRSHDLEETMENEFVNKKSKKSCKSSNHDNSLANESELIENSLLNGSIKLNNDSEEKCAENEPVKKKKKSRRSQDPEETMENELVNKKRKKSLKSSNHDNSLANESELMENSVLNGSIKLNSEPEEKCAEDEPVKKKKKSSRSQDSEGTMENELVNKKSKKSRKSSNHENSFANESELMENSLLNGSIKFENEPEEKCAENESVKKTNKSHRSQDSDKTMEIEVVNKKRKKSRESLENSMDGDVEQTQKKTKKRKME